MAANVGLWGVQQLSNFLQNKGISQSGIDSIKGNGISGEIFLELCEEDIKDAFAVFKDRFTIRKLLRELKSNTPSPSAPAVTRQVDRTQQQIQRIDLTRQPQTPTGNTVEQNQNYRQSTNIMPSNSTMQSRVTHNLAPHGLKRKWPQDNIKSEPYDNVVTESNRLQQPRPSFSEPMKSPVTSMSGSPQFSNTAASQFSPSSRSITPNKTVNETVSSSQDLRSKTMPYPVALTRVPNNVVDHQFVGTPTTSSDKTCMSVKGETSAPKSLSQQSSSKTLDQSRVSASNEKSLDSSSDGCPYMLSLVTSSISRFTVEELLGKKGVRERPTEAQRLGTVLIRNAAQSIKIWDCPPLLRDIPDEKRDAFMNYIISSAPQLITHTELVWTRLREALQNRRKYLLDKESGRRGVKGSTQESRNTPVKSYDNTTSIKTEPKYNDSSDDLIDLTF